MRKQVRAKLLALESEREKARLRGRKVQERKTLATKFTQIKKSKGIKTRPYLIEYFTPTSLQTGPTGP